MDAGWDILLAGLGDYCIEVIDREVNVVVVGDIIMLELFLYCSSEFVPVSFLKISVGGFGSAGVGSG